MWSDAIFSGSGPESSHGVLTLSEENEDEQFLQLELELANDVEDADTNHDGDGSEGDDMRHSPELFTDSGLF